MISLQDILYSNVFAFTFALLIVIYSYFKWSFNYWKSNGITYVKPSIPFGNVGSFISKQECLGKTVQRVYQELKSTGCKYGGMYTLTSPRFIPIHPEIIKNILTKDFNHFTDRGFYYNEKDDPLSVHLFSLPGQKWRNLRQKLTPTFTSGKMKMMFQTLVDCSVELTVLMDKLTAHQEPIDIKEILGRFTTDIIGSCAFGVECNSLKNPDSEFRTYGRKITTNSTLGALKLSLVAVKPNLGRMLGITMTPKDVETFFMGAIKDTVEYRIKNNVTRKDFIQLLIDLEDPNKTSEGPELGLTVTEMAAQSFLFFLAGFETSSTTMTFCLFELAIHEDVQIKVREEVEEIIDKYDGKITYEAIMEMNYMEQVINETLRKYPPLPVLHRMCSKDYKVPGSSYTIREGETLLVPVYGLHHDPEYYPDPDKFDPERFNEKNIHTRPNFTHLPFGDGPRNCIGLRFGMMQTKVGLAVLLKNYRFGLNKKTKIPIHFDPSSFILSTDGGMWLNCTKI